MAAVSYRCLVDESCPEQSQPGFCAVHPRSRLEPIRPRVVRHQDAPPGELEVGHGAQGQLPYPLVPLITVRYLGNSVQVPAGGLILGRDTTPALELPGQVSRRHAHLHWDGPTLQVTDLVSTNGTFVDGQRIPQNEAVPVKPGQTLRLGDDVELAVVEPEVDQFGRPR